MESNKHKTMRDGSEIPYTHKTHNLVTRICVYIYNNNQNIILSFFFSLHLCVGTRKPLRLIFANYSINLFYKKILMQRPKKLAARVGGCYHT